MNLDQFVLLSSLMGDELYKNPSKHTAGCVPVTNEKLFQLLANKPIGAYMTSGLPNFWAHKKVVPRFI
ncbi:hypothetical protein [Fibrella aquatilis]|uniref:Uncharacterized protein n=1 Tax=Fibrella aquatilis TaxID=2817059 RepID=A0A939GCF3_9BACT|nr:hypothetical protein [Fibrella aquatilis]MBO0934131.1 hypothetical protein [Fibrella aquatilis]